MINQLNDANQEVFNLRTKSERLHNYHNTKKKTNERTVKSQESMNQLIEKTQYTHKGKTRLGCIE